MEKVAVCNYSVCVEGGSVSFSQGAGGMAGNLQGHRHECSCSSPPGRWYPFYSAAF